ncbi:MAG TPA: ATP-binding protein [Terriglobales bacterium]|nr:ATP-binding protein [Terriglobales bacterium]
MSIENEAGGSRPSGSSAAEEAPARLLVVDDEPTVTDLLQEFLSSLGYEVEVAANGEAAAQRIPVLRPEVVLSDLNMTGLTGLDVMRLARATDEETVVILITGETTTSVALDAIRQGAYDYIIKPFELDDVQRSVERALATRRLREINRRLVAELREKNEILSHHEQELTGKVAQATWQMRTLFEVGKEVSTDLELAPRLEIVAAKAAELSGARATAIYLRLPDTQECRVAAVHNMESPHAGPERTHLFAAERAIGFQGFEHRTVRAQAAPGQAIELPLLEGARFESLLALPLKPEKEVIGLLVMVDKPNGFTADDEQFMELYASQVSIAVQNSQLYEHTRSLDRLKSEFVAVVSHEIRTPLTSVKGAIELLTDERYFENNEQQNKLLSIAHANAERLLVLINDILDFSKLESASLPMCMEVETLEPVVRQAIQNLRTLIAERRIVLDCTFAPDLPDLLIDANRIAQVLTNLLSNAIKFSPPEGRIEVRAETQGAMVRVSVRDYGEGIAAEDVPKLFRKFSQLDSGSTRPVGGTGLGLVICKGIVEQHGGSIGVESVVGEGSTFYFLLPYAVQGTGAGVSAPETPGAPEAAA